MADGGTEKFRIQARDEIESFLLQFTKKYKSLLARDKFVYLVPPNPAHRLFPYEILLEIAERK